MRFGLSLLFLASTAVVRGFDLSARDNVVRVVLPSRW
jgi:hypothetical protein